MNEDRKPDEDNKFSAARVFEDWSRPVGVLILGVLIYAQVEAGIEVNSIAWGIAGVLVAGDKISQVLKK